MIIESPIVLVYWFSGLGVQGLEAKEILHKGQA